MVTEDPDGARTIAERHDGPRDTREHMRLDVNFATHPKLGVILDPVQRACAGWLLADAIAVSRRNRGDGHVLLSTVLAETGLGEEYAKDLFAEGLLHGDDHACVRCPQPRRGHVYIHDYLDHQPSAETEARRIANRRRAGAAGGAARMARLRGRAEQRTALLGPLANITPGSREARHIIKPPKRRAARTPKSVEQFAPIYQQLCDQLADAMAENGFSRPNITVAWLNDMRLLVEKNGKEPEKVAAAIQWSQNDHFWFKNIHSPKKLREKYERLSADAQDRRRDQGGAPRTGAGVVDAPAFARGRGRRQAPQPVNFDGQREAFFDMFPAGQEGS